jgi:hypothetical protein
MRQPMTGHLQRLNRHPQQMTRRRLQLKTFL